MHKDVNELIDLDSLIQLYDRANNELLIIPENTVTTSEPSVMKMNLIRQIIPCMFLCIYLVFIFNPFTLKSDIIFTILAKQVRVQLIKLQNVGFELWLYMKQFSMTVL